MLAKVFPLLTIAVLMFAMGFFMLGSLPLLVLKHDTPKDGNFIRSLFNVYYTGVAALAMIGAAGCLYFDHLPAAFGMGVLALFVIGVRSMVIPRMDRLRAELPGELPAVRRFRRLHIAGMVLNVVQLAIVIWGMTRLATA